MRDVITPMTFNYYTGNCQDAFEGWLYTKKIFSMLVSKILPDS